MSSDDVLEKGEIIELKDLSVVIYKVKPRYGSPLSIFPALGGDIVLSWRDIRRWFIITNIKSDEFYSSLERLGIDDYMYEKAKIIECRLEVLKDYPERHFSLVRVDNFIISMEVDKYATKIVDSLKDHPIADKICMRHEEVEKEHFKAKIIYDVLNRQILAEEKLRTVSTSKERRVAFYETEVRKEDPLDQMFLLPAEKLDDHLFLLITSDSVLYRDILTMDKIARGPPQFFEHERLSLNDILELSKAYVIILRVYIMNPSSISIPIVKHVVAYDGKIFQIVSDTLLLNGLSSSGDSKVFAKRRYLTLSKHYKQLFPSKLTLADLKRGKIRDIIAKAKKLKITNPDPLTQLFELFYNKRPFEKKQEIFKRYFEIFEEIMKINPKTKLLICFPNAYRFKAFQISKKGDIWKIRAYQYKKSPSQIWIRGRFLEEYIKSKNLQDYITFIFGRKDKKLEILRANIEQFYEKLFEGENINEGLRRISEEMTWQEFNDLVKKHKKNFPRFLREIFEYFGEVDIGQLRPKHVSRNTILRAKDKILYAIKNNKPDVLLEEDTLKWIRNAIKYILITKYSVKPKAGLVITGNPKTILKKAIETSLEIDDIDLKGLFLNSLTSLDLYQDIREEMDYVEILMRDLEIST